MAKLPVIPVPSGFRFQPIDAAEVATRLVELAAGKPAGLVSDMGGPRVYEMGELLRGYLRATNRHRLTHSAPAPTSPPRRGRPCSRGGSTFGGPDLLLGHGPREFLV
jgi:uncharacterized protein YbjT (DUF2867 family)